LPEDANMSEKFELDEKESKLYRDHFYFQEWSVNRANQDFICDYKDCKNTIKECGLFIMYENLEGELNYCIKHGLQGLHGYKNGLDDFEVIVRKFRRRKKPC